ncbi:MAG TPA: aldo/keto reductase [Candidatus Acidoferrales bacterium]|nr:aldo/keto reductase [Candidatus Acidoferrales bacterium]
MSTTITAAAAGTIRIGERAVHRLGFGAMRLTGKGVWGWPPDREGAVRVLRRAVELGVNFIDTSDAYGPEVNEELIAQALAPYSSDLVIATKGGLTRSGPGQWAPDCRPERLRSCCEASLRRLRLDHIELYQLHTVDPRLPYADQIGALADLRKEGKIRHIGVSNVALEHLRIARSIVEVVSVQNRYNFADRESEPVLQACERDGLVFIPWFPLDAGEIGKSATVQAIAARTGCSPYQLAIAWLLRRSRQMLPIPGTSSAAHLEENIAASGVALSDDEFAELSAPAP